MNSLALVKLLILEMNLPKCRLLPVFADKGHYPAKVKHYEVSLIPKGESEVCA